MSLSVERSPRLVAHTILNTPERRNAVAFGTVSESESTQREQDAALVERIIDGDRAALEAVFNQYGGAIKSMALRVLRNETLAEDTVQDVFVDFWKAPQRFDATRGSLRTFLITIAHRRAVDVVRSEQARFNREEKVFEDVPPSIDDEVWSLSLSESVREALGKLNENERKAITLAYFGDMSYVEVAAELGEPEGTVKSRIRTGMRKMGRSLTALAQ
jgi:RNA polymerase sigma-70 factor (ECF subfamily)